MSKNETPKVETAKNYSTVQEQAIIAASPLTFETAKALGETFTPVKSARSVVSKALQLKCEYTPKAKPAKKVLPETKAATVRRIAALSGVDADTLEGLEKATAASLKGVFSMVCDLIAQTEPENPHPVDAGQG